MMVGKKNTLGSVIKIIFIVVFTFIFILPIWLTITSSFEDNISFAQHGYSLIVHNFTTIAYQKVFQDGLFWSSMFNSFWVTCAAVVLSLILNTTTAYALYHKNMPFHKTLNTVFVLTMFFNAGMIPTYLVIKSLGMTDSFLALILPVTVSVYNILLIRNYLYTLPASMEEAALVDGDNYVQILWSIIIPISKPVIVTTAFMTLIFKWNSWMDVLIYISKTEEGHKFWTVQYYLRTLRDSVSKSTDIGGEQILSASIVITLLPVVLLFPSLQKYFVTGISAGSVKG